MKKNNLNFLKNVPICWSEISNNDKTLFNPIGIVVHSSGRDQKFLRYYIQPEKNNINYLKLIKLLGRNNKKIKTNNKFHFWIGMTAAGDVQAIATKPLNLNAWDDNYIHICICEDDLTNYQYLEKCIECLTLLCQRLKIYYSWSFPQIIDHSEISNYPDIKYWLNNFNLDFNNIRPQLW